MRVGQVMTRGVKAVTPAATLLDAARAMARLNVGAIPVVQNNRPVGILTDRDIAVRAIARGLSPRDTCVRDIMSTDLVACTADDSLDAAVRAMESRQIRRLPVLNRRGQLAGMLSLGDLAVRSGRDRVSGEALEQISRPSRPSFNLLSWLGGLGGLGSTLPRSVAQMPQIPRMPSMPKLGFGKAPAIGGGVMSVASAAAIAAGAMYFTDPGRGRRRRALVRDQFQHLRRSASDLFGKAGRDMKGRGRGLVAQAGSVFTSDHPTNEKIVARVRSALGRAVSHPGAIQVQSQDGVVTLSGVVLADEVDNLIARISSVRGVRSIENQLQVEQEAGNNPSLQGGRPRNQQAAGAMECWAPSTRVLAGTTGLGLVGWGLGRRDLFGLLMGLAGTGLAVRGFSNMPASRLVGIGAGRRAVDIHKSITINRPVAEVFEFFRHYENFPHVMRNVREVRPTGDGRSHWVVSGPAGISVEWDAVTTRLEANEVLAWESEPGSRIQNAGIIRFQPAGENSTRVDILLGYNPPGGALGHLAATLFGADPKSEMDQDLMRAKVLIETGRLPHDAAQPIRH